MKKILIMRMDVDIPDLKLHFTYFPDFTKNPVLFTVEEFEHIKRNVTAKYVKVFSGDIPNYAELNKDREVIAVCFTFKQFWKGD